MEKYVAGKTAIVTGAASGIGRALAAALAVRGAVNGPRRNVHRCRRFQR